MLKAAYLFWLSCAAGITLLWLYTLAIPNYSGGSLLMADGAGDRFAAPQIDNLTRSQMFQADFSMHVAAVHPNRFKLYNADMVAQMQINGQQLLQFGPNKKNTAVTVIDLSRYLKPGVNSIHLQQHSNGAYGFSYLLPDVSDPLIQAFMLSFFLSAVSAAWWLCTWFTSNYPTRWEALVFSVGALLRINYTLSTAYFERTYDIKGHLPYIQILSQKWTLPVAFDQTVEYFQPPAYYFLCALTEHALAAAGYCFNTAIQLWQLQSCIFSLIVFWAAMAIARACFPRENWQRVLFSLMVALSPVLIYSSSAINNDELIVALSAVWLYALMRFRNNPNLRMWLLLTVLLSVSLLTKASALSLIIISATILVTVKQLSFRKKIELCVASAFIIFLTNAWFYLPRALAATSASGLLVSNIDRVARDLRINEDIGKLTTLDPAALMKYPFSCGFSDPRREIFWEYFFKSSLFGENFFKFNDSRAGCARALIISSLLLMPVVLFGYLSALWTYKNIAWTLAVVATIVLGTHFLSVLSVPYVCMQNFRYSTILIIPTSYFAVIGIAKLPLRMRKISLAILAIWLALSAAFVLSLGFTDWELASICGQDRASKASRCVTV